MNCFRCAGAGRTPRDTTIQIDEPKTQENKEPAEGANGDLTAEQKTIIQSTWKDFKRGDYVKDAAHIYIDLFCEKPETMAMFGLSEFGLQPIELQRGSHLHRFVVKVCDAITVCVDNLDNSAVVDKLLYDLGCSHYRYGAKEEYFEAIQHGVLHSLELRLGPQFDDKAKSAWTAVLILISQKMIEAMRQQKADKQLGGGHNEEEEKTDNSGEGGSGGQEEARRETDA